MKTDSFAMTLLFDCYGDLLTEKQRACFDQYCNQDLSLAEIAENEGISRQGVHDSLARTEAILQNYEEKTGCAARAVRARQALGLLAQAADGLEARGAAEDRRLAALVRAAADLIKE